MREVGQSGLRRRGFWEARGIAGFGMCWSAIRPVGQPRRDAGVQIALSTRNDGVNRVGDLLAGRSFQSLAKLTRTAYAAKPASKPKEPLNKLQMQERCV